MGSGCNSNNWDSDECINPISDKCVTYTGEPIPVLGICTGDNISETVQVIIDKLLSIVEADGGGITLNNITANCEFVQKSLVGKDKDLATMIQVLFDQNCTLSQLLEKFKKDSGLGEKPFPFDLQCLCTPTTKPPTKDEIIQALIDKVCKLDKKVEDLLNPESVPEDDSGPTLQQIIETTTGNFIKTHIKSCSNDISYSGTGLDTELLFRFGSPVGTLLFGDYDPTWFDTSGKGRAGAGMCGWSLADGRNNTWDMRGLTPVGATQYGQGQLLPSVTIAGDATTVTGRGDIKGLPKITLSTNQIPEHSHSLYQEPHNHTVVIGQPKDRKRRGTALPESNVWGDSLSNETKTTSSTLINLNVLGVKNKTSEEKIDIRQPSRYGVWIQRVSNIISTGVTIKDPQEFKGGGTASIY